MPDDNNRRSNVVFLSVLGLVTTVAIADKAIPQPIEMRRNVYASRADCERDYPSSECQSQNSGGGGSSGGGGGYHGPYYSTSRSQATADDPGPGRIGSSRAAVETSYRGGFGAFGRAVHAAA
ncbi:MAG TPA: hypothetical protein VM782_21000 [Stellaceae bacterium]|nr:hypothetical protein [Stellaceae bacterium]